ncbi:MAG: glycosyltransferase family 4 protein [Lachnospiraceae bacterium]|nr:glycosyltransferase family 4 protein [Lachnospiraceae bacterium]
MKIAIDLTPVYDHLTGVERYNIGIAQGLIKLHPEDSFILVFKNEVHPEFLNLIKLDNVRHLILKSCNKLFFIQYRLMKEMNKIDADYYLFLSFTSPFFFRKKKAISAIFDLTCWDCPETMPVKMKYYYRLTYKASVKHDWKTITSSEFSGKRIRERYRLEKADVPVIYGGLSQVFLHTSDKEKEYICKKYGIPENYILTLSTVEPRKNLQLLISAYRELDQKELPDLVLAGRKGWKLDDVFSGKDKEILNKIHFTDFVDDEDLPALYANAALFVFPSKYEGFGFPVIEAMSQGTLVLSSDAASLPEVVGTCGVLFKSEDKESLKSKLLDCLAMPAEEKNKMITEAKMNAEKFNWDNAANKLYRIMKDGEKE